MWIFHAHGHAFAIEALEIRTTASGQDLNVAGKAARICARRFYACVEDAWRQFALLTGLWSDRSFFLILCIRTPNQCCGRCGDVSLAHQTFPYK